MNVIIERLWMKCGLWPWRSTIISVSLVLGGKGGMTFKSVPSRKVILLVCV